MKKTLLFVILICSVLCPGKEVAANTTNAAARSCTVTCIKGHEKQKEQAVIIRNSLFMHIFTDTSHCQNFASRAPSRLLNTAISLKMLLTAIQRTVQTCYRFFSLNGIARPGSNPSPADYYILFLGNMRR